MRPGQREEGRAVHAGFRMTPAFALTLQPSAAPARSSTTSSATSSQADTGGVVRERAGVQRVQALRRQGRSTDLSLVCHGLGQPPHQDPHQRTAAEAEVPVQEVSTGTGHTRRPTPSPPHRRWLHSSPIRRRGSTPRHPRLLRDGRQHARSHNKPEVVEPRGWLPARSSPSAAGPSDALRDHLPPHSPSAGAASRPSSSSEMEQGGGGIARCLQGPGRHRNALLHGQQRARSTTGPSESTPPLGLVPPLGSGRGPRAIRWTQPLPNYEGWRDLRYTMCGNISPGEGVG